MGLPGSGNYMMARPEPTVVAEIHKGWIIEQVMLRERQYMLTYAGQLVTMKAWNSLNPAKYVKYMKTNWSDESRARTMVLKLNERFKTNKFGYVEIGLLDQQHSQGNNSTSQA